MERGLSRTQPRGDREKIYRGKETLKSAGGAQRVESRSGERGCIEKRRASKIGERKRASEAAYLSALPANSPSPGARGEKPRKGRETLA